MQQQARFNLNFCPLVYTSLTASAYLLWIYEEDTSSATEVQCRARTEGGGFQSQSLGHAIFSLLSLVPKEFFKKDIFYRKSLSCGNLIPTEIYFSVPQKYTYGPA